jgi:hypothetical protein
MSCSQVAASSGSASAARTGGRLHERAVTPWTSAKQRGKACWKSVWPTKLACSARLDNYGGMFTDVAGRCAMALVHARTQAAPAETE